MRNTEDARLEVAGSRLPRDLAHGRDASAVLCHFGAERGDGVGVVGGGAHSVQIHSS